MTNESIYRSPAGEKAIMDWYESVLTRWPVPFESRIVPTRHGDTFVLTSGNVSGSPLVMLHGAGTNSAMWIGDVAEYGRHHRLYLLDLPGEPGKSASNRLDWAGPAYSEWLEDVLNVLQVDRVVLLGMSQGAWVASKFATAYPHRVSQLVLLTPGGIVPDRLFFVFRAMPLLLLGRWGARRVSLMLFGRQKVTDEAIEANSLLLIHCRQRLGILPLFTEKELRRLTMPVMLLGGKQDVLRDVGRIAARLQTLVPNLKVIIVPEGGHALLNTPTHIVPFLAKSTFAEPNHNANSFDDHTGGPSNARDNQAR